jgi:4-amino-4-deoxy-L-arabinose transferase-like glycosyltransferase
LTYHEALVAQGAREILASGEWSHPSIGGLPWLEKPPLPWWLTAALGYCAGGVDETVARFPSAVAAMGLVVGVALLAARHFGRTIGLLAGAIQTTTAWTVMRGRLAEADVLLACLVTWTIVAFDRLLDVPAEQRARGACPSWRRARWAFFALWGLTSLVKGIGFGAVIVFAIAGGVLIWQRDRKALCRLLFPAGWLLAAALTLSWPCWMIAKHGSGALGLWAMHVAGRLGKAGPGPFAGETWWEYVPALLGQALPWTPLALVGAWHSLRRAFLHGGADDSALSRALAIPAAVIAGDRLLWAWSAIPIGMLALPAVKNAHYAVSAQVPWSVWAALGLARLAGRLRGWDRRLLLRLAHAGFAALTLLCGLGYCFLGPLFERRGIEWAFYESAGRRLPSSMPLVLLYDDWDRLPYKSPSGSIPHDLAVRLFYLRRPACWHRLPDSLRAHDHVAGACTLSESPRRHSAASTHTAGASFAVIGRGRDLPSLDELGRVEVIARGPGVRWDRAYTLFHVTPEPTALPPPLPIANTRFPGHFH